MKRSEVETARLDTSQSANYVTMIRPKVLRNDDSNLSFSSFIYIRMLYIASLNLSSVRTSIPENIPFCDAISPDYGSIFQETSLC